MTRKSDVHLVKGWLLEADEIANAATGTATGAPADVPEGWEHGLLLVLKDDDAPYSFYLSVVEPDAETDRPRYFAGWVHGQVLLGDKPYRAGSNGDVDPYDSLVEARAGLARAYREVAGNPANGFDAAWVEGVRLFKEMKKQRLV